MTRLEQARMAAMGELNFFAARVAKFCVKEDRQQFFFMAASELRDSLGDIFDTISAEKGCIQARELIKNARCRLCEEPLTIKNTGGLYYVECSWAVKGKRIIGKGETPEEALADYRRKEK